MLISLYMWNLYLEEIGRVFVDNGVAVNILLLSMLEVIGKIMEDLMSTRVAISGFSREIIQAKWMILVSLKVDSLAA